MKRIYSSLMFISALLLGFSAYAVEEEQTWKINLKEAEIRAFITQVADITETSFVIDPRVKGKVTVISHSSLDKDEVYELFLSVLHVHGFSAVPGLDGLVKIVPNTTATKDSIRNDYNNEVKGEEFVTRVIAVKNTSANELIAVLRPMIAQHGHLAAVPSANSIIISDHGANIERLVSIIDKIDGAESEEIEVIQLKEAWVTDIVALLENLTPVETGKSSKNAAASPPSRVRVVADERTNRLILKGEKSARARVKTLVDKLDTPSESSSGSTQVIYLSYAEAKKVAEILTSLVGKAGKPASSASGSKGKTAEDLTREPTFIQADETLNALVVKADPASMEEIKDIIRQLDVRRSQVLIEAAIIEVKGDIGHALGVQWGFGDTGGSAPVGATSFSNFGNSLNDLGQAAISAKSGTGALTGTPSLGDGLSLVGAKANRNGDFSFGAFLQAVSTTSNTNILSTPSIVTLDNEEAEIIVGQEVPITTGSQTTSGSTGLLTTTERKDVGLTLKVIPHIHEGNSIRLEIDQQSSDLATSARDVEQGANTITTKRSIKTTILAEDREFIVLGGLVQEDDTEKVSKVPLLGDIPFIGVLFRSTQIEREKKNLMVFLKPTILRESDVATKLSRNKYQLIRELQLEIDNRNGSISLYKDKTLPKDIHKIWVDNSVLENDAGKLFEDKKDQDKKGKKKKDKGKKNKDSKEQEKSEPVVDGIANIQVQEEVKSEEAKQEEVKQEEVKQEEVKQEEVKQEEAKE